jgi:hypothetical protein
VAGAQREAISRLKSQLAASAAAPAQAMRSSPRWWLGDGRQVARSTSVAIDANRRIRPTIDHLSSPAGPEISKVSEVMSLTGEPE